jgi:HK97 family phage prohead protease
VDRLEVRAGSADTPPCIVGHAAVFNTPAQITRSFTEQIAPGAFKDSIGTDDVRALFNHDPNFVLGRNKAGTLRLAEDDKGLAIEIDPPDTQWARDLMVSIKRGDISQMSFGFVAEGQSWDEDEEGNVARTLNKVRLFDVSPVTYPAYNSTDVAVRSFDQFVERRAAKPESIENLRRRLRLAESQI